MRNSAGEWPSRANAAWLLVCEDPRGWLHGFFVTAAQGSGGEGGGLRKVWDPVFVVVAFLVCFIVALWNWWRPSCLLLFSGALAGYLQPV